MSQPYDSDRQARALQLVLAILGVILCLIAWLQWARLIG